MDQCQHCQAAGNLERCSFVECPIHNTWYARALRAQVRDLLGKVAVHRQLCDNFEDFAAAELRLLKLKELMGRG